MNWPEAIFFSLTVLGILAAYVTIILRTSPPEEKRRNSNYLEPLVWTYTRKPEDGE